MLVQPYDSLLTVYENICEGEQNRMMFSETNTTITFREFTIYPNPNNGSMNLNYEIGSHDKGEVIIYDISGRKINAYVLNANVNILKIDENALENGVYMYSIFINGQIAQSDKIVIIK
jgi:ribosomal protein S6